MISTGDDNYTKMYIDNLKLKDINNNIITKEVEIAQETGQTYIPNEDTRTSYEKNMSILEMKTQLFKILKPLNKDPSAISSMIALLSDDNVEFVYKNHPYIIDELMKKYGNNVSPDIFDSFIDEYQDKIVSIKGLDNTLGFYLSISTYLEYFKQAYETLKAYINDNQALFLDVDGTLNTNIDLIQSEYEELENYMSRTHPTANDYDRLPLNTKKKIIDFINKSNKRKYLIDSKFENKMKALMQKYIEENNENVVEDVLGDIYLPALTNMIDEILIPIENMYMADRANLQAPIQGGKLHSKSRINLSRYKPIGRYFINHGRLIGKGILSVKSKSGQSVKDIGTRIVSNNVKNVMDKIIKNKQLDYEDINVLTEEERLLIDKIADKAGLIDIKMPTKYKTELEKLVNRYMILSGEIEAGNDNSSIIKELKQVILKLSNQNVLPKGQAREILLDIIALGY